MTLSNSKGEACRLGFVYEAELIGPDGSTIASSRDGNIVPQVGIDHLVALLRGTGALISNWYVGVYEGNFVPTSGTTSADLPGGAQESQAYSEAARPEWDETYDGVSVVSSLGNRADFSFTADKRLYGAFLCSSSIKGGDSGTLLSIARFSSPYDVPAGSTFRLGVAITLLPAL